MTAYVAIKIVQEFLLSEEVDPKSLVNIPCESEINSIEIDNCSFEWLGPQPVDKPADDNGFDESVVQRKSNFKGLQNLSFDVKKGEFVFITGPIGSVKSSLLYALSKLMKETYNAVVSVCALDGDLNLLDCSHNTEIGERGVTVSGGQRQRLTLARTVYKNADIYLFNYVLSAVDAHVGKHIMDNCMLNYLDGKTRVLATHQLNLIEHADRVLFLNSDYSYAMGTVDELLTFTPVFKTLMNNFTNEKVVKTAKKLKYGDNSSNKKTFDNTDVCIRCWRN